MANSLQDQFLKAGLTTEKKLKEQKHKKGKKQKQKKGQSQDLDEAKLMAQKLNTEKQQRDRELNKHKEETARKKAIVAQIKQLIEMNSLDLAEGEIDYNFEDSGIIKKIAVDKPSHEKIANGKLAIAKFDDKYFVIPLSVANKIKERDSSYIIVLNENDDKDNIDDEYADFQVPDDLMW